MICLVRPVRRHRGIEPEDPAIARQRAEHAILKPAHSPAELVVARVVVHAVVVAVVASRRLATSRLAAGSATAAGDAPAAAPRVEEAEHAARGERGERRARDAVVLAEVDDRARISWRLYLSGEETRSLCDTSFLTLRRSTKRNADARAASSAGHAASACSQPRASKTSRRVAGVARVAVTLVVGERRETLTCHHVISPGACSRSEPRGRVVGRGGESARAPTEDGWQVVECARSHTEFAYRHTTSSDAMPAMWPSPRAVSPLLPETLSRRRPRAPAASRRMPRSPKKSHE